MELVTGGFAEGSHMALVTMARAGGDKANGHTTRNRHVERAGEGEGGRWWEIRCTRLL